MAAPWVAVPLPAGKPLPSGPMLMSQSAMSASETGLPRPGVSAALAASVQNASTSGVRRAIRLRKDMLRLPLAVDRPACTDVHVPHRGSGFTTGGNHFGPGRLDVAGFVPGAALQDHRLTVPAPWHAEAGQCLAEYRRVEGC